jgi:hypothetical protein
VAWENIKRVIDAALGSKMHGHITNDTSHSADQEAGANGDESRCWSNSDEANDCSNAGAESRGLSTPSAIKKEPGKHRRR